MFFSGIAPVVVAANDTYKPLTELNHPRRVAYQMTHLGEEVVPSVKGLDQIVRMESPHIQCVDHILWSWLCDFPGQPMRLKMIPLKNYILDGLS